MSDDIKTGESGFANSDTPRTTAATFGRMLLEYGVVKAEFAAQLERELAEANAKLAESEAGNARLRSSLSQLLLVQENADETGYVTDVGFLDLDAIQKSAHDTLATNAGKSALEAVEVAIHSIEYTITEEEVSRRKWFAGQPSPGMVAKDALSHLHETFGTGGSEG